MSCNAELVSANSIRAKPPAIAASLNDRLVDLPLSFCTPNVANPPINEYGITAMSADSASLELQIRYKDGSGDIGFYEWDFETSLTPKDTQ